MRTKTIAKQFWEGKAHTLSAFADNHFVRVAIQESQNLRERVDTISYNSGGTFNKCYAAMTDRSSLDEWDYPARVAGSIYTHMLCSAGKPNPNGYPASVEDYTSEFLAVHPSLLGSREMIDDSESEVELKKFDAYSRLMQGNPDNMMNIMQALFELKDLRSTLKPILDFMDWAKKSMGKSVSISKRVTRKLTMLTTVSKVASAYLWYQFGVEPTVQDVRNFLKTIEGGKLKVTGKPGQVEFEMSGKVIVSRFRAGASTSDIAKAMFGSCRGTYEWEGTVDPYNLWPYRPGERVDITFPCSGSAYASLPRRVHPVSAVKYVGTYMAQYRQGVKVDAGDILLRRFNWNCGLPSTLWEVTPFSFLVDWIVDVGSFIRRLERRWGTLDISRSLGPAWLGLRRDIVDYYPGIGHGTIQGEAVTPPRDRNHSGPLNVRWDLSLRPVEVGRTRFYSREQIREAPTWVWPVMNRQFKLYQVTTGMALLAQAAAKWSRV